MANVYAGPMKPAPNLVSFARKIDLAALGVSLHVYEAGDREVPAMLLIHGLQDEADSWRHVIEPLAQTHHVIALDLPGFGRSTKGKLKYGLPLYVDVVLGLMNALRLEKAALVGNSLGGMVAEAFTLAHPERVSRLVLVDGTIRIVAQPTGARSSSIKRLLTPFVDRRYFEQLRKNPQGAYDTLYPFYVDLAGMPQADRDFLFQRVNERVWDERQRLASLAVQMSFVPYFVMKAPKLVKQIPALQVPTTVIWGKQDDIVPIRNGEERAKVQPGARWVVIAGAGHLPHQEKPEAFLSFCLERAA
jgi:pimeloyl-ACP methyl ester carboxylesterase